LVTARLTDPAAAAVVVASAAPMPAAPRARRRRAASPLRHGQVLVPVVNAPALPARGTVPRVPAKTWATVGIGPVSKAGGEFPVDWAKAHADAQRMLGRIDFSKRGIVIWCPGTSNQGVHRDFDAAAQASWGAVKAGGASVIALEYEASWNLRPSVATGIATLKLVLQEIARRGGKHSVVLAGESQGSWIAGEVLADPKIGAVVDRAVLMGHPWLAAHQYADGQDPRVAVINHPGDLVTLPVKGDVTAGLDAMIAIRTLQFGKIGTVAKALLQNPTHAVELLKSIAFAIPFVKTILVNPHVYGPEMTRAVEFLRYGRLDGAAGAESELAGRRRYTLEALEAQKRMRQAGVQGIAS